MKPTQFRIFLLIPSFAVTVPLKAQTEHYSRRVLFGAGLHYQQILAPIEGAEERKVSPGYGVSLECGLLSKSRRDIITVSPRVGYLSFKGTIPVITNNGEYLGDWEDKVYMFSVPLTYRRVFAIGSKSGIEVGLGAAYNFYPDSLRREIRWDTDKSFQHTEENFYTKHFSFHLLTDYVYHFKGRSAVSLGFSYTRSVNHELKYSILTTPFDYVIPSVNIRYLF